MKRKYYLEDSTEVHTAWILRPYYEQKTITGFESLDYRERRSRVAAFRRGELLRLQRTNPAAFRQARKNYRQTEPYIHLTIAERQELIKSLASCVASWGFARLFAECIDKIHFDPARAGKSISEQAFEQLVSRFEQYLQSISQESETHRGLLIHDNNPTVASKHTALMKAYFQKGTLWTHVKHIIETPLFVDSELTGMIQVADVCAYALRRYVENGEETLFDLVFKRADRRFETVVGVRHFTDASCKCRICQTHRPGTTTPLQLQLPKS